jgi:hypothetical protein
MRDSLLSACSVVCLHVQVSDFKCHCGGCDRSLLGHVSSASQRHIGSRASQKRWQLYSTQPAVTIVSACEVIILPVLLNGDSHCTSPRFKTASAIRICIIHSDFGDAFWLRTLCFIFMHWGKTFRSFATHKYGSDAKRKDSYYNRQGRG